MSLGGRVAAPARRLALVGAVLATLVTLVGWPPGRPAYGQTAQPTATAATAATTFAIGGTVWFDRDGNGQREADEPLIFGAALRLQRDGQHEALGPTDADGTYRRAMLAPGAYTLQALVLDFQSGVPGGRALLASAPRTVALTGGQSNLDLGLLLPPAPPDDRYFAATGYRIDNDTIWAYFRARGGIDTFGYPVSRTFTFLGHSTQIFQRHIVQACCPVGWARPMNLLDRT